MKRGKYFKVEFYRGNIEGRGEALEYYGAAAQIATRPVINQCKLQHDDDDDNDSCSDLMMLQRCFLHSRTRRNCNTTELQRLRTAATLTPFPLDRSDDDDD